MGYAVKYWIFNCHFCFLILLFLTFCSNAQVPFHKGVNLTHWFQAGAAKQIQFTKFTKKDFENIKSLGCDVIRLPINLHAMTGIAPDYTLDPLFLQFLDSAVEWSEELEIYLILDNHSFDPAVNTEPSVENILVKVWSQMARHYKGRSGYLLYEVLNEPHGISDAVWGAIQQSVIEAIRLEDSEHFIIVGGSNYNSYMTLSTLPFYTDDKLIYTFHFYDPFLFTHQGASWLGPSLVSLRNIPFPYQASSMPALPAEFDDTWIESAYNSYPVDGTVSQVRQLLNVAVDFRASRNVPVFCGEFGVYIPNSDPTDRVGWYEEIRAYLNDNDIPWTIWDYKGGFGLFEANSNELFESDLNVPLLEALEFEVPPQTNFVSKPETKGFIVYDDYAGEDIITSTNAGPGIVDYYNTVAPHAGEHAIFWADAQQYDAIVFDFTPNVDLSLMRSNGFELSFWVRGNSPGTSFDVRFVDTKKAQSDHPWRMGRTIDEEAVSWDGGWHNVSVPLDSMQEKGSWDNGWFNPEGKFQWSAIDRFEIVAEQHAFANVEFFFDNIELKGNEITIVVGTESESSDSDLQIYPNPLLNQAMIEFSLNQPERISLSVFDLQGRLVRILVDGKNSQAGTHYIAWKGEDNNGHPLADGLYMIKMLTDTSTIIRRVIVLNR
jgi:endoglucanase